MSVETKLLSGKTVYFTLSEELQNVFTDYKNFPFRCSVDQKGRCFVSWIEEDREGESSSEHEIKDIVQKFEDGYWVEIKG